MANFSFTSVGHFQTCSILNSEFNSIISFPSKGYFIIHILLFTLSVITIISTIFLNLITIITFHRSTQLKKKTYNFLIYVQSINDLGVGLILNPLLSSIVINQVLGNAACKVNFVFFRIFLLECGFSVAIVSAMNYERFAGVVHPVFHRTKLSKEKVFIYVAIISLLFICVTLASIPIGEHVLLYFTAFASILHLLSTVYAYSKIFSTSLKEVCGKKGKNCVSNLYEENGKVLFSNNGGVALKNNTSCAQTSNDNNLPRQKESTFGCQTTMSEEKGNAYNETGIPASIRTAGEKQRHTCCPTRNHRKILHEHCHNLTELVHERLQFRQSRISRNKQHDFQDSITIRHHSINSAKESDELEMLERQQLECCSIEHFHKNKKGNKGRLDEKEIRHNQNDKQSNQTSNRNCIVGRAHIKQFSKNLKLAKSCFLVVIYSFMSFLPLPIFSLSENGAYVRKIIGYWCFQLFLQNATLDSLIFFWGNKMLRKEAIKTFKTIWSSH